jgi:hypothetical protein
MMSFIMFMLVVNLLLSCCSLGENIRCNRSSYVFVATALAALELIAIIFQWHLMFGGTQ